MKRLSLVLVVMGLVSCLVVPAATAEEVTVDDYIDFWRPVMGMWEGTLDMDGQTLPIVFRARVAPNNKCIIFSMESEGVLGTQYLEAYDPVAKRGIIWGVDKEGKRTIQTVMIDGMEKGLKAAEGVGGTWNIEAFEDDGTTVKTTTKWTITESNDRRVVMVWSDVKEDGEPKPDMKMVLERQQPARKRRAQ